MTASTSNDFNSLAKRGQERREHNKQERLEDVAASISTGLDKAIEQCDFTVLDRMAAVAEGRDQSDTDQPSDQRALGAGESDDMDDRSPLQVFVEDNSLDQLQTRLITQIASDKPDVVTDKGKVATKETVNLRKQVTELEKKIKQLAAAAGVGHVEGMTMENLTASAKDAISELEKKSRSTASAESPSSALPKGALSSDDRKKVADAVQKADNAIKKGKEKHNVLNSKVSRVFEPSDYKVAREAIQEAGKLLAPSDS